MIKENLNIGIIYVKTYDLIKALLQIEKCIKLAKDTEPELYILCKIHKAIILNRMNNSQKALKILGKIRANDVMNLKTKTLALFFYAKGITLLNVTVHNLNKEGKNNVIFNKLTNILRKYE